MIKSVKIDGVDCRIGQRTKKPSTVTMVVDNEFVIEALELFEANRKGETPETGLVQIRLVAEYSDTEGIPEHKRTDGPIDIHVVDEPLTE